MGVCKKIGVVGCGRWGTFIAWYLDKIGHQVSVYGREHSVHMQELMSNRRNNLLTLTDSMLLTTDLEAFRDTEIIIISISSQSLRVFLQELKIQGLDQKKLILCMKGIEIETGKRLSEIVEEVLGEDASVAVWLGPGHVQEFIKGVPNCMVIDSKDQALKEELVEAFSSDLIRFYYGTDLIGNEIGGATKNVIGIAAGMLDGMGLSSLKGALMSRGTREVARLIAAMGGNELSAYGLCHLGDYEATVFSEHSHNRTFGACFVKNEPFTDLAEGYYTVKALMALEERYEVDMPISHAVYELLYEHKKAEDVLLELFARNKKKEF